MRVVVIYGEDVHCGHYIVGYIDDDVNVEQVILCLNAKYRLNLVIDDYLKTRPECYTLKNLGHAKCNAYIDLVPKIDF